MATNDHRFQFRRLRGATTGEYEARCSCRAVIGFFVIEERAAARRKWLLEHLLPIGMANIAARKGGDR